MTLIVKCDIIIQNKVKKRSKRLKKIICSIGILFLIVIISLNLIFTAKLEETECINIVNNNLLYITLNISLAILIYFLASKLNKRLENNEKKRKKIFYIALGIFISFNIIYALVVNPKVIGDSVHVCNLAQTFYRGNVEEFLPNVTYAGVTLKEYMQAYPQQLSLAFAYSIFFRIIYFDIMEFLRVLNVIGNIGIVIALYKINEQLSKQYKTNKTLLAILILTFISLPLLVTFIYGDIPSIALCLFSVYFMMKYIEGKTKKYFILATIFTMIAYMMRMNSLIFIIATVMYLILKASEGFNNRGWKENILNIIMIIIFIVATISPSLIVKNYYFAKYDLDKSKIYPNTSYFLMGMEKSSRGNGWYNEAIATKALKNPQDVKQEYVEKIKERITYFYKNPREAFEFYTMKIASMWTENTYSAVRNNNVKEEDFLENIINPLTFYQKALLIITCICSLIVLIQNRRNLSLELIFLLTIFVGGFTFHILWEAKSRYIIPYIIVLIPIASIKINEETFWDRLKKFSK